MMKRFVLCIAGGLACTGCHSLAQARMANAPGKHDAGQLITAAAAATIEPGEYQYHSRTIEMKMPRMPADYGQKQIEEERSGQTTTVIRHCISREEALDPTLIFSLEDKACRSSHFAMADGKIHLQLVCQRGSETETRTISGTYTSTSFSADVQNNLSGGAQSGAEMKSHLDAQRIGVCSGDIAG